MTRVAVDVDMGTVARHAARRRLLNAFLRELAVPVPGVAGPFEVRLPASGRTLRGTVRYRSMSGLHDYTGGFHLDGSPEPLDHDGFVALLLRELDGTGCPGDDARQPERRDALAAQIANSVRRTTRYLTARAAAGVSGSEAVAERVDEAVDRAGNGAATGAVRRAEQSVLFGHPMHPTPKSAEGFGDGDLAAYAPELGAEFRLHYFAVHPGLTAEERLGRVPWLPERVLTETAARLGPDRAGYALLPVHPWQARHLLSRPVVRGLVAAGTVVPLGPLGAPVYPTSSVRTVCDPDFGTVWKLPLHVRITNFVRVNPADQVRRAVDASRILAAVRGRAAADAGLNVLTETGYRAVDHPELFADTAVLFRENPFTGGGPAGQVLAGLLDERPWDPDGPALLSHVRRTGDPCGWLRAYCEVMLLPVLRLWSRSGVSLEGHVQNTLVELRDGWPVRCHVRDMEGVSVSRQRPPAGVDPASAVLYDDAEAWLRLRYYVVTNHLCHLVAVLGAHLGVPEERLWAVVANAVRTLLPDRYAAELLTSPTLPAKANLISRFHEHGERPVYVAVPNPMREVSR